jgi:hypothetical protein
MTASPITYEVDGKQYVAIAAGTNVFAFGLFEPMQSIPLPKITRGAGSRPAEREP